MKLFFYMQVLAIAASVMLGSSVAVADEASESNKDASPGVIVKVKKGIERGAKAVAHGVERGANATARGIKRGVKATSNAAHAVADKVTGSSDESSSPGK